MIKKYIQLRAFRESNSFNSWCNVILLQVIGFLYIRMKTLRCTLTSVSETEQEQDTLLQINHLTDYKLSVKLSLTNSCLILSFKKITNCMILRFLMLDLHNLIFLFYSKINNSVPNERNSISNFRQKKSITAFKRKTIH